MQGSVAGSIPGSPTKGGEGAEGSQSVDVRTLIAEQDALPVGTALGGATSMQVLPPLVLLLKSAPAVPDPPCLPLPASLPISIPLAKTLLLPKISMPFAGPLRAWKGDEHGCPGLSFPP